MSTFDEWGYYDMSDERKVVIIAGPNGAGKTTFALEFLPNEAGCPVFVNADLIAAGLAPFQPEKSAIRAGRLMLEEIKAHIFKGVSFAFETTLSGRGYARMIPEWRRKGYRIKLIFLMLPNVEIAIERVATRVARVATLYRKRLSEGGLWLACATSTKYTKDWLTCGPFMTIREKFLSCLNKET
jgi:guanylate kinase